MGVYQIRQAKGYSKEHQTHAGKYQIFVKKEQYGVQRAKYFQEIPAAGHTIYG